MGDVLAHAIAPTRLRNGAVVRTATVSPVRASAAPAGTRDLAPGNLSIQLLLQLQRAYGNAAVGDIFGVRSPAVESAPVTAQRCGDEMHEGCSCARGGTPAATLDPGPTVEETGATVQRDVPDPAADKTAIPPDSPYATMPAGLMNVFKESYRNNTMLFQHSQDVTLVRVLDRIGMSANSIAS